jgi:hypothetical protein
MGWPDVVMALIAFATVHPVRFLFTVPLTGIVMLTGAFLFLRVVVIRPIQMHGARYEQHRHRYREPRLPLE